MEPLRFSLEIVRPTPEVFEIVSELENDVMWQRAVLGVRKLTRGAPGAGSRYLHRIDVLGKVMETESEFVSFEPHRTYAIRSVCGPFAFRTCVDFTPSRAATRLDVLIEGATANPLTRLAAIALSRRRREEIARDLERLKRLLESGTL